VAVLELPADDGAQPDPEVAGAEDRVEVRRERIVRGRAVRAALLRALAGLDPQPFNSSILT